MLPQQKPAIELTSKVAGIMIGTPCFGGMCYDAYLHSMMDLRMLCHQHGIPFNIITTRNESDIKRARNRIMSNFLASDCSHLVFIDADIGFQASDVLRLVAHNMDIVGATYAKKSMTKTDFAFVPLPEGRMLRSGLVEIGALPGGFFAIHRDCALRMYQAYIDRRYVLSPGEGKGELWEDRLCDLFGSIIDSQTLEYWTEDYAFSRRWRELGGSVWLDPYIRLEHSGTGTFTGDPLTSLIAVSREGELVDPGPTPAEGGNVIHIANPMGFTDADARAAMGDKIDASGALRPQAGATA